MQISLIHISFLSFSLEYTDFVLTIFTQIKCLITLLTSNLTTLIGLGGIYRCEFRYFTRNSANCWHFPAFLRYPHSLSAPTLWSFNGFLTRTFNRSVRINIRARNTIGWTLVQRPPRNGREPNEKSELICLILVTICEWLKWKPLKLRTKTRKNLTLSIFWREVEALSITVIEWALDVSSGSWDRSAACAGSPETNIWN